jgi:type IV pilus assembly protein PilY1
MKKYLLVVLFLAWSNQASSDDVDLYINDTASSLQRPNVLIILDNSPSMDSVSIANSKSALAREIIIDLVIDNPSIDFALQLFNHQDNARHGGRIVYGFNDLSVQSNRDDLLEILDNDTTNTNTNTKKFIGNGTPLCETLYETYRYLSGGEVLYGNDNQYDFNGWVWTDLASNVNWGTVDVSEKPASILNSGPYISPFENMICNKQITIIYITDGEPTADDNANGHVKTLTGAINSDAKNGNFLGILGSWMATKNWLSLDGTTNDNGSGTDIDDTPEGALLASVKIHTVGFGDVTSDDEAVSLLKIAARDGVSAQKKTGYHTLPAGGKYHEASTAAALKTSLEGVILEVLQSSTLTSASVSANSFDRTQTLDSVYYGMFEPSTAARWQGNLKKYKIVNGVQKDALGNVAVNSAGEFDEDSKSFWSTAVDGNDVTKGGVAGMLRTTDTADRKFFTDISIAAPPISALTEFSTAAEVTSQYADNDALIDSFGIPLSEVGDVPDHIRWAMGVDVDDEDTTTLVRSDVFGDPLHSKPIVINYGTGNPRIVIGTNSGVLHMFEDVSDTSITESWAYLPEEFFKNIKPLRENSIAVNNKIYGLDGQITLYINDVNNNGKVDTSTDTAWIFFGLRRGGSSYYAIDITYPDSPKLMWHIENPPGNTNDFKELGLTFSQPKVVKSSLNKTDPDKLVVIFGGGYDIKKDLSGANTHDDNNGAAVYMVNARTGARIFRKATGSKNGIASSIASLDSDSDGLVDRLYVGDTGGDVWRLDMPDATLANTSLIKLASLGGRTNLDDRRFFNQPSIVRTYILETFDTGTAGSPNIVKQEVPYDAILLGSGDKATPIDDDTKDMFFMIKDKHINTQKFGSSLATAIPTAITLSTLYDYTDDPFNGYPTLTPTQESKLLAASLQSGWHFDLKEPGEKSSAKAIVINNVVNFTSYTPSAGLSCSVTPGDAWLYTVDLALGIKKYNWNSVLDTRGERIKHIGNQFLGAPTLISTPVTDAVTGETNIQGNLIVGKEILQVGFTLQTMRTSLTIPEN